MALSKAAATALIAKGTSNPAFAPLLGCSATRSGTTATLVYTAHGRSNGQKLLIQGFDYVEFNGIFTISNVTANTFDYTISADPGANPSAGSGTVYFCTLGTALSLADAYDTVLFGGIQNGNTAPTVSPEIWVGYSNTTNEYDYVWGPVIGGNIFTWSWTPFQLSPNSSFLYVNVAIVKNVTAAVDAFVLASKLISL